MLSRDDVIRMARECGAIVIRTRNGGDGCLARFDRDDLERFAEAVYAAGAAAEREAGTQDRIDAARYRIWRESYAVPDGDPCTDLDIAIGDAWAADELDAVLDAEIRQVDAA